MEDVHSGWIRHNKQADGSSVDKNAIRLHRVCDWRLCGIILIAEPC